jgi:hypothetical protein
VLAGNLIQEKILMKRAIYESNAVKIYFISRDRYRAPHAGEAEQEFKRSAKEQKCMNNEQLVTYRVLLNLEIYLRMVTDVP